jgi:NAD-dependent deacetylase
MRARPNAGHLAIAAMQRLVPEFTLITQNVDDLHQRAGSSAPIHLHGSLFEPRCRACSAPAKFSTDTPEQFPDGRRLSPPRCNDCGDYVRPGVVWFGEALPEARFGKAAKAAGCCEVLLSIGTSSLVYPAADIPVAAARAGALVIQINPQATALDSIARYNLREPAARALPEIVRSVWDRRQIQLSEADKDSRG